MLTNTFQLNNFRQPQKMDAKTTQHQVLMTPSLSAPMRWVARLILSIICFVWYSSSVYAVVEEINKPPAMNKIENFFPLGAELEHLRKNLLQAEKILTTQLQSLEGQPELALVSKVTAIKFNNLPNIKKLDKKQRQQMAATLQHYKDHQLAKQIIQRQASGNLDYEAKMASLYQALNAISADASPVNKSRNTNTAEQLHNQHANIKTALALLAQPMSNMPQRYSNNFDFITPPPRAIYTLQSQIDNLIGTDAGNYTATDSATHATQAISGKVTELGSDPLTLYQWVHNTIRWLPSYGVMQGADYTMQAEQGNAFDTASLLIALLREAGHEARYRYGIAQAPVEQVRNWVGDVKNADAATNLLSQGGIPQTQVGFGGAIEAIRFEHVWVEVNQAGNWLPLDPSFKQYTYSEGIDLETAVPFDAQGLLTQLQNSSTSNEAEGWVQGVDATIIEAELTNYQSQLETYLNSTAPNATLGDVLGLQTINASTALTLPEAAPSYTVLLSNIVDQLPETLFHKFHFQVGSAIGSVLTGGFSWDSEIFELNELTTNLVGKDMAISFRPATQADEDAIDSYLPEIINSPEDLPDTLPAGSINMIGELTLNGVVVRSTPPVTLGTLLKTRLGFERPQGSYVFTENDIVAGQYQAVAMDMQGVSPRQLEVLQAELENTKTQLETNNSSVLTRHDITGGVLQAGVQGYMAMTYAADRIAAQSAGVAYYRQPGYGTFSTHMEVSYSITSTPIQVTFAGAVMDVDRVVNNVEEKANCYEGFVAFNRASGMRGSAYEHEIPEQLFSTDTEQVEGVSTVKALAVAMAQGQRIYTLTPENSSQLSNINIDDGARAEIAQALNLGLEVTVHESPIMVNGWHGSGYAILNPNYGVGAYQITGGFSGSAIQAAISGLLTLAGAAASIGEHLESAADVGKLFKSIGKVLGPIGVLLSVVDAKLSGCGVGATVGIFGFSFAAWAGILGVGLFQLPLLITLLLTISIVVAQVLIVNGIKGDFCEQG